MTSTELDPRFDPRFQRGYDPSRHRPLADAVVPDADPPTPAAVTAPTREGGEVDLDDLPEEAIRRRNPYLIALVALPVVLFAASALVVFWYTDGMATMMSNASWSDYDYLTLLSMFAPALIITAFVSLIAVLMYLTLGRGRRG
jgi:uncharacterized membrane protein YcjF (UPF0283 family)